MAWGSYGLKTNLTKKPTNKNKKNKKKKKNKKGKK